MNVPLFQVDAFTNQPFTGNPAAVCLLPRLQSDNWMQAVAAEMNLSETAFLVQEGDGYRLWWFAPVIGEPEHATTRELTQALADRSVLVVRTGRVGARDARARRGR